MTTPLLLKNRNFRLLFVAGALTNLGDGLIVLAVPWFATLLTRDPVAIASVAAAARLPWLLFALPAGVIIDRIDRRKLIARADLLRGGMVLAIMMLALSAPANGAVWILAGLTFLLGCAEVLRDNAAQTMLPSIVESGDLESANGQMWSAEQLTGQFIGPPLAGVLIGLGIAVPFGVDAAALVMAAGLVWLINLPVSIKFSARFWDALLEGVRWMRGDVALLRLAIVLGLVNFLYMTALTVAVLFSQEVMGLSASGYGLILSVAAVGAITGSLSAKYIVLRIGSQASLYVSLATWGVAYSVMALTSNALVFASAMFFLTTASMLWNVITVSWRQRRIPADMLGRVNSIYRFFGWGSMPLGALFSGVLVSLAERETEREIALRAPLIFAAVGSALIFAYALSKLRLN